MFTRCHVLFELASSTNRLFTAGSDESRQLWSGDDDEAMQLAIQQYFVDDDSEQVTLWEALRQQPDADLQRYPVVLVAFWC